ncbi:sigma-70 family RNA polymerase sigma factor [Paenibacillus agilis]|uniref:Sigma-70 family RNA polymerase sigma factor n=1 Tax=Paenibacillus agilis TaxID=3020863 RepID=A0A559IK96_9BACL|nr:sigma-70 family RNA polymerase sigma factor [Paenibacillus agilis]TVX88085.1 sigma-70 family RNA polymerase sigma factor [Paenibacillus agilis]
MNDSLELNETIQQAVSTYSKNIIRIAFAYVKNVQDAEDIAQDVFVTYMQKRPVFENKEHEKAWLIRIAINKSKNYLKSGWFRTKKTIPDDLSYLPKEEGEVLQAVLQLDPKYRIPLHLFYYEGYSIQEIAAIVQTNSSTIGTRLARGRSLLKIKVGGNGYE